MSTSRPSDLPTAAESSTGEGPEHLFYDGDCGVCHWSVIFVARRDPDGSRFRFAPLGGAVFAREVPAAVAGTLPDSIVVRTHGGDLLVRSSAALYILRRIGGGWRVVAALGRLVPRPLRDWAYDRFARVRHRLVAKPHGACPMVPPDWRDRFDA